MPLNAGTRLGPYEVQSPAGAGGMGEVYRARDTRLDRQVAIKVLPSHLSSNPDLKLRFEREARSISRLSHPHICVLHDVGHQDGVDFLVMEYLEGETLADRLEKGPVPIEQALTLAIEIADALDKAHQQGIVHRDLKPANIMLTSSGGKLMDFGLAKPPAAVLGTAALSSMGGASPSTPTINIANSAKPLTQQGTILGTFQYMAPEVLQGAEADARSDIFSFGCVIYEMVTGRRAFDGKSQISVLAAILERIPEPISKLQPMTPAAVDHVVRQALQKHPAERWQSAHDIRVELQWIKQEMALEKPAQARARRTWQWVPWAAMATVLAVLLWVTVHPQNKESRLMGRFAVLPPPGTAFVSLQALVGTPAISISPDGSRLAFMAAERTGRPQIWIRLLDSLTAHALAGTDDAVSVFWSPNSRSLAFFAEGKLKRVDVSTGTIQTVCDAPNGRGGTWNNNDVIVFASTTGGGLSQLPASGGTPKPATRLVEGKKEWSHRYPTFLPDGRHFLYLVRSTVEENNGTFVGSLDGEAPRRAVDATDALQATFHSGYLLYVAHGGALLAQPFDLKQLRTKGNSIRIAEQIGSSVGYGYASYSVSSNGVLVYAPLMVRDTELWWFNRKGERLGKVGPTAGYATVNLSPNGKWIVTDPFEAQAGDRGILLADAAGAALSRLTFAPWAAFAPVWSSDGKSVIYSAALDATGKRPDIYIKPANGAGQQELFIPEGGPKFPTDWSLDGKYVAYHRSETTGWDVYVFSLSDRKSRPLIKTSANEMQAQFSPDGRWIAYTSDESGGLEVYVRTFLPNGGTWRVSVAGGSQPRWRRDGKELFYVAADSKLMSVAVRSAEVFNAATPQPLFDTSLPSSISPHPIQYAVAPDGQRFLINTPAEKVAGRPLTVVLNWTEQLRGRESP
jgi:Tol biopolymer transport system component